MFWLRFFFDNSAFLSRSIIFSKSCTLEVQILKLAVGLQNISNLHVRLSIVFK